MKRFFKRLLIILLIVIVLVIGVAVAIAGLFEKQIGNRILASTNNQLKSELRVEDFQLSVLPTFPTVAANLNNVVLEDSRGGILLEADELSFRIGLLSFLSSNYQIRSVVISDGALNILINPAGAPNYDIFKDGEKEAASDNASRDGPGITLEKATLRRIEFNYQNEGAGERAQALLDEAAFSGEFANQAFSLQSDAQLAARYLEVKEERFLENKALTYEADVFINLADQEYTFNDVIVAIEENEFRLDGKIKQLEGGGANYDLLLSNEDGNLEGVLQLLPAQYFDDFGDFTSTGKFTFNAFVQGEASSRSNPEIRAELQLEDGSIRSPRLTSDFRDVAFVAKFNNGQERSNRTSVLEIENLKGYFNRELMELKLRIENFDNPLIDFGANGLIPMASVYRLFGNPRITDGKGEVEFKQLQLRGSYDDMVNTYRIDQVDVGGGLEFDDAGLVINNETLVFDKGILELDGNQLLVKGLKLEGAGSELNFEGQAFNLIPVLFADSLNSRKVELEFAASLQSDILDIDRLLNASPMAYEETQVSEAEADSLQQRRIVRRERITDFLKGTFNVVVDQFNYNKINASNFTGQLEFDNNELNIRGSANGMEGVMQVDGQMYFRKEPRLEANVICENLNVSEFFRQTNNFSQDVLTDKNVSGIINAKMMIEAYWDRQGNFQNKRLRVLAGLGVNDGMLTDVELLENFSAFVKIKDLRKIDFVNLQNFLEIRNQTVFIPAMFIRSNAVNLTLSGEHRFDQSFRYNLKVNAGQVLVERFKRYDPSLTPKPAKREGFFNMYYTIYGNEEDYDFETARSFVKSQFQQSQQRKRNVQAALESEFGPMTLIQEPVEWQSLDEEEGEETEYLEFELEGGDNGEPEPKVDSTQVDTLNAQGGG